jgi:hypothetical protein
MRIQGKKPWALIDGKICRFSSNKEYEAWYDDKCRAAIERFETADRSKFLTADEVLAELERDFRREEILAEVRRRRRG